MLNFAVTAFATEYDLDCFSDGLGGIRTVGALGFTDMECARTIGLPMASMPFLAEGGTGNDLQRFAGGGTGSGFSPVDVCRLGAVDSLTGATSFRLDFTVSS